ncbi:chemotaxis protein CheA [Paraconexibacter antarcticus]|uniref:Chemotaxis protein CheA n=1 Tax=Paraconexibacter antarcticus TaxID=2949664 RepID=A0ABY5DVV7_9ACTN|nr:chemotaxis protein CheA [Paraconexibacter antarcticus]UTI64674.1 chemotaxis protein CheA [Paraconexibacter antarcticus]
MDTSEYMPMFLAECREHLQELNLTVVRLEESPDDRATLDEIFRAAHSLKGMSATMGFDGIARLTHQMEDVFELLRQRTTAIPVAVVDVVLECLDALGAAIDTIDADGVETIEPDPLIERLQTLVRAQDHADAEAADTVEHHPGGVVLLPELEDGERLVEVDVTLAEDVMMPAVRAYMVLAALREHGTVVASVPAEEELDGFSGKNLTVTLVASTEDHELGEAVRAVDDVGAVTVMDAAQAQAAREAESAAKVTPLPTAAGPAPATAGANAAAAGGKAASTVRVDAERLDQLMHYMGELVVQRTLVESLAAQAGVPGLAQAVQELTRSSHALQSMVMQIRMIPVEAVFLRFPRLVRDVSSKLGKQVDLQIIGQDTELDRTVVDALGDPLVHLVRNSLDHGLESPADRVAAGKEATGTLQIAARHGGGSIIISVRDDGRGVDPVRVAERALSRGLITAEQAALLDVEGAVELLFAPGFSTAETVGDLSGRGVGMDAVRTKIRALGGEVLVTSTPGEGTVAEIRLPLTLAIMSALLVEADGDPYGIALNRVQRTMRISDQTIRSVAGAPMLMLDDEAIPVLPAADAFGHPVDDPARPRHEDTHIVLVHVGGRLVALSCSKLIGQRELVTRPLPPEVHSGAAVSGAAVLSNGSIVLLADCDALRERLPKPATSSPIKKAA